jgi:hypothetical protein
MLEARSDPRSFPSIIDAADECVLRTVPMSSLDAADPATGPQTGSA